MNYRIESLLSARLHMAPQIVDQRIFFISNLSGKMSLYVMNFGGSVPEPLLPPNIALQNPELIGGKSFYVFPKLGYIIVMLDQDGDENYKPMKIPMNGGFPEPIFEDYLSNSRVHLSHCDGENNIMYLMAESRTEQNTIAYQVKLEKGEIIKLGESPWGSYVDGVSRNHKKIILSDGYTAGDNTIYLWTSKKPERRLLYGIPLEERKGDQEVPLNAIFSCHFSSEATGLLFVNALFDDNFSLGFLDLNGKGNIKKVKVKGLLHNGMGELIDLKHLHDDYYLLSYNIDGCSWLYEALFVEKELKMKVINLVVGSGDLENGVVEGIYYDERQDLYILSFSTATSPTQLFTVEGKKRNRVIRHTNEQILGIPDGLFSGGKDASYDSWDGLRISARLYLPAKQLAFKEPYPIIYYIHGGPHSQEQPNFAWFSMPLIQFLTLQGFVVFVPNVRGSSGYGLKYMKYVDHDWGGSDRLDHVHAVQILAKDKRLDVTRIGVVGRSYGGYMSLTLAFRHPELWKAAVDMFGPYDLLTFSDRIPETWKPYFAMAMGDPVTERDLLIERSPKTYMDQLSKPLLVIQGKNDPRVVEAESHELVNQLKANGKNVDYLMFENEGHDVLKYENRVACYNTITEFFVKHLNP